MPRKRAAKTSNTEKYKRVQEYASKLQTKNDQIAKNIKQLYENNTWDFKNKSEQLQEELKEDSINNKDIQLSMG